MSVPVLVREEAMRGTGFFPPGREQTYHVTEDDFSSPAPRKWVSPHTRCLTATRSRSPRRTCR